MRRSFLVFAAIACVGTQHIWGDDAADRQTAVRNTVEKAVAWLQDRGENWKDSRQCASCHHVPLMKWAMQEAKTHRIEIDDELLQTTTDWFFTDGDPAKAFHKPGFEEDEYQNPLSMVSLYTALSELNAPAETRRLEPIRRVFQSIVDAQEPDGSWKPFFGKSPMMGSRESLTLWLTNLTNWPGQPEELKPLVAETRRKSIAWLKNHHDDTETHVLALRLWMLAESGDDAEAQASLVETLMHLQRDDGGWSQTASRASDAYATGHVLFALQIAGVDPKGEALRRGIDYLAASQANDGSWPMISRESPPILVHAVSALTKRPVLIAKEKPTSSIVRNSEPITFISTAWATVALLRTLP